MFKMRHWKSLIKTSKCTCLLVAFICLTQMLYAQRIVFINAGNGKLIEAKEGDVLSIQYHGYLGQTETFKNTLTEIKDSSFVLGIQLMDPNNPMANKMGQQMQMKEIRYCDVVGFRRMGIGRVLLKSTLTTGAAIGTILVLNALYRDNAISDFGKIGISLGVGLSVNTLINLLLPERPNHFMQEGWQINPLKE